MRTITKTKIFFKKNSYAKMNVMMWNQKKNKAMGKNLPHMNKNIFFLFVNSSINDEYFVNSFYLFVQSALIFFFI